VIRLPGEPPSPWEVRYGFSRVVRAGGFVVVGGTTSVDANGVVLGTTPYDQTVEVFRKLSVTLPEAGAALDDVVQVRIYVTDISRCEEVGRAFEEVLGAVRPVMTMVEVSALIDPRMLVEVEVVATAT
jgi:enamine deaminase RidA (YjgF/YER057c/UK114 family)